MKQTIEQMIAEVIKKEGGYVNHPADNGGPTKWGITLATLEDCRHKKLKIHDVKQLTKAEAAEIYEFNYYLQPNIDSLPDLIQPVVFDMAVNSGASQAITIMQLVIHKMGSPLKIDGICGPKTRQSAVIACNVYGPAVVNNICAARLEFLRGVVVEDPSQVVFLAGWENRANSFLISA